MGAMTDSLTAVETVLTAQTIASVIKELSNVTPPVVEHAILKAIPSSLDREDVDNFGGTVQIVVDWFYPGLAADGQTEFLAAMDRFDALIVALIAGLDRSCIGVDPDGNIIKEEESADLKHWYSGTITVTFLRKEPASV